ncbi:MAG: ABC transporter ATP-binding protein [Ruminobacter sp.]|nr:ABC transporter ATP-binding protein [Ruminobacter sp.]
MHLKVTGLSMFFEKKLHGRTKEKTVVLNDINFELKRGSITQIIGPSGCGKSTFLNIMCGLLKPTSGNVFYDSQSIYSLSDTELAILRNQKFGIALQKNIGIGSVSVIDNVNLPYSYLKHGKTDTCTATHQLLELFGISHLKNRLPGELSGGEMRRMCLARALVNNPEFIFADEPTSDLDSENTDIVMTALKNTAKKGTGILVVSHDSAVYPYADETFTISNGVLKQVE